MDHRQASVVAQKQQEDAKYQDAGSAYGLSGVGTDSPKSITVGDLTQIIIQKSAELRERSANIASQIAGSIPEPNRPPESAPDCLVGILGTISRILTEAIAEITRTQQSL